ncbi:MAG: 30S ribosomal protein S1, partial [Firmicutes bacterium]|nr:30S ribosomal protein S1 [Bacillota bacterium]
QSRKREGKITLSRLGIARKLKWAEVEKALQDGTVLSGRVKEATPAGLVVDLGGGLEGFMPGSMVDVRYIPDFKEFVNTEISFKVMELRREREKVILSRKQLLEEETSSRKEQILGSLQAGQIIRGTVRRLTTFGAFVDVGGIDGLVHVSEISWNRVEHPSQALKVGEEVEVKIIELVPERERIGLSIRQAQPDPWTEVARKFKPGDAVEGRITRLVNFGAFVELIPGVEGLVHISQLANHHVKQPSEVVSEGQDVKVKILDINTAAKRVSLSMREAAPRSKKEPVQQHVSDAAPALTLGDLFGDLFNGRKGE